MSNVCPQCGSKDIDFNGAGGNAVCIRCGCVLEENIIVSEITFQDTTGGQTSVVGQFVPATGVPSFGAGALRNIQRESREQTIQNGRKRIAQVAATLHLTPHHVDAAQRLFMLAVQNNFVQGRKTQHVVAACLYIVCRRDRTPHLLIDFSDVLQTNVFVLGATFLKLCSLLHLHLPIIDPSLYIHRFAAKLNFGDSAHKVSMSALRLVARMKRDWMAVGRRPSGICGAALLVAAKLHGFNRTHREIIRVVRICNMTLKERLEEFEVTDASNLTAEQFAQGAEEAIAREADPPSFARNRREEAAEKAAVAPEIDDDGVYTCARCHISENVGDDMNAVLQGQVSKNDLERMTARLTPGDVPKDKEAPAQPGSSPAQPPETQPQDSQSKEKRPKTPKKFKYIDAEPDPEFDGEYQDDEIDDAEIDAMLVSPEEMEAKSQVWNELNKDYLDKIKQMETDGIERKPRQRKKKKRGTGESEDTPPTAADAAARVIEKKKLSDKINYAALKDVMGGGDVIPGAHIDTQGRDDVANMEVVVETGDAQLTKPTEHSKKKRVTFDANIKKDLEQPAAKVPAIVRSALVTRPEMAPRVPFPAPSAPASAPKPSLGLLSGRAGLLRPLGVQRLASASAPPESTTHPVKEVPIVDDDDEQPQEEEEFAEEEYDSAAGEEFEELL